MTCPHAETTTLLWLAGEAPPELEERHAHHVADCPDCQEVLEVHASVAAAVGPVAHALARPTPALARPTPVLAGQDLPTPANRSLRWVALATVVAAAALALVFLPRSTPVLPMAAAPVLAVTAPDAPLGDVDAALEAMDLELADLSYDFRSL